MAGLSVLTAAASSDEADAKGDAQVADAYARSSDGGFVWTIGTKSVEMTFDGRGGSLRLVSFLNKACQPPLEYVDPKTTAAPFSLDANSAVKPAADADGQWALRTGSARQVSSGGRPAVELDLTLVRGAILTKFHVLAFPGTAILRQRLEIENKGSRPFVLDSPMAARFQLRGAQATSYVNSWLNGVAAQNMGQAPVTSPYRKTLTTTGAFQFFPWTALHRSDGLKDGLFVALECVGTWSLAIDHGAAGSLTVTAGLPDLKALVLKPGQRLTMPVVTLGVFRDGLDSMAASLYDWQYEYLWDYTNADYHARSRCSTWWFYSARNLQEQFTARLAFDLNSSDAMRTMGYEVLWDDAGWSPYPGDGLPPDGYAACFQQTYEGPDFAQTQQYLHKTGMNWLLWFVGFPSAGVLDSKIGAWGDFEWRTDALHFPNMAAEKSYRTDVERFLDAHPGCAFNSGTSHTFELYGRYLSYTYLNDLEHGPYVNHYFSYLETPDRCGDGTISILSIYGTNKKDGSCVSAATRLKAGPIPGPQDLRYEKESARGMLTAIPSTYWGRLSPEDTELARRDMELYRFFRCEGLAGRWSYVFHPTVQGDQEYYYFQRTSHDHRKACIILTHRAENPVVVRPRGLLPEAKYVVGFDSTQATTERTGAALMTAGIAIKNQKPGELIYLNLPNRPGSGQDKLPPQSPGRVLVRRETNIGHGGIGVYWSPGADNNWISYYEVRRDGRILEKVAIGDYYFDHAEGWSNAHEYAVRTVDGDGNASDWRVAEPTTDEPLTFAVLGGHFAQSGRDGWSEETTADNHVFKPMTWAPPARNPAADFGGTPNQRGGVEGYWEGFGGSRVGRGWQQASKSEGCVRAWTAPKAGTIRIMGRAMREYYCVGAWTAPGEGTASPLTGSEPTPDVREHHHRPQGGPLKVAILHGQHQIWPKNDWATVALDLTGVAHDIKLNVASGDVVRFVLDKGTVSQNDAIAWMPRIVYDETNSATPTPTVVRILCGAKTSYTDRCGNLWAADQQFAGGEPVSTTEKIEDALPTPEDQPLYQNGRAGKDFSYSIPVPTGLYAVRLKFAEPKHPWMFERPMNVEINDQRVLTDFDIVQMAKGPKRAVERTFRNIVPNADGKLVLHFTAGKNPLGTSDDALVQAIEVLPEQKPAIRINGGSETEFVDWNSNVWTADAHFSGGTIIKSVAPVLHASPTLYDQDLYRTARSAKHFSYTLAAPSGLYTVHLKFAELWLPKAGERPMDIAINGRRVRKSWDPAAAAGRTGMAADLRIDNITPDKNGHIVIALQATGVNDAILQAIEIE
jgi:hypothetical protein